jgi:hypothetical protein|tara:strand:+ start:456 stop:641 length:186 start_codon:yes stop_codon:yes gene_type:complete
MKTYTYTTFEAGRKYPVASVKLLGNGKAIYSNFIALVEEELDVNEAFAKAKLKSQQMNSRY